jgi:hypothetical protein
MWGARVDCVGRMAKRVFQAVVLFFAVYAFAFVPLGEKTALEHLRAIWGTPAAQQAASEVKGGVQRLVKRLRSEARESTERSDDELEEPLPTDEELAADRRRADRDRTPARTLPRSLPPRKAVPPSMKAAGEPHH